jgi:ATP-binding cassette subfamily B protein
MCAATSCARSPRLLRSCWPRSPPLTLPLAISFMIDVGFSGSDPAFVNRSFSALIVVAGVLALASSGRYYLVITLGERIVADLRNDVFAHLPAAVAGLLRFLPLRRARLAADRRHDADQVRGGLQCLGSSAQPRPVQRRGDHDGGDEPAPLSADPHCHPVIVLPIVAFGRQVRKSSRLAQDRLGDASAFASEAIGGVRTVQAFTLEAGATAAFQAWWSKPSRPPAPRPQPAPRSPLSPFS